MAGGQRPVCCRVNAVWNLSSLIFIAPPFFPCPLSAAWPVWWITFCPTFCAARDSVDRRCQRRSIVGWMRSQSGGGCSLDLPFLSFDSVGPGKWVTGDIDSGMNGWILSQSSIGCSVRLPFESCIELLKAGAPFWSGKKSHRLDLLWDEWFLSLA